MPFKKIEHYSDAEIKISEICFALAHPARVRLIDSLLKYSSLSLDEISHDLNLSKASCNRHLTTLRNLQLVKQTFIPNLHLYELNRDLSTNIRSILNEALDSRM